MNNYGISKTPWHFAVTALVLICLAGFAIWLSRREPIYRVHLFKKYERAFIPIVLIAFLVFDYTVDLLGQRIPMPLSLRAWVLQIACLQAFVFLRHASRFEICAKICAGGVGAFYTLALPPPSTIVCGGSLTLLYAIDYIVVRRRLRRKAVIALRTVSAAVFTLVLLRAAVALVS